MGRGIAQVCAQAGMTALLFDSRDGAAREAVAAIDKALDGLVAKGRMTADVKQGVMGRLRAIGSLDEVAPAGIVIEAIVEDLAAKRELFRALEQRIAPDAVLATNTSSLSVTEIAAGCADPGARRRPAFLQSAAADAAGRGDRRLAQRPRFGAGADRLRAPHRQASGGGDRHARLRRQSRRPRLWAGGAAHRRARHRHAARGRPA